MRAGWEKLAGVRYAHRGYHEKPGIPENSLPAFRRAADRGFGVELDVHLTRDGRLAVTHDADLTRVCGRAGVVEALTAAELAAYRLEGTAETVPFLEEVLPIFEGRAPLVIEVKPEGGNAEVLTAAVMDCLDRFSTDYCVESFDPAVVRWLKTHRPAVLRGQLSKRYKVKKDDGLTPWQRFARTQMLYNFRTRPDFVAYRFEQYDCPAVRFWRRRGAALVLWTIRSKEALAQAERDGAVPIFEGFDPEEGGM